MEKENEVIVKAQGLRFFVPQSLGKDVITNKIIPFQVINFYHF